MTPAFLKLFKHQHPKVEIPVTVKFRTELLRFSTLLWRAKRALYQNFHHHHQSERVNGDSFHPQAASSLTDLRCRNRARARAWWNRRRAQYSRSPSTERDHADQVANRLSLVDEPGNAYDGRGPDDSNDGADPTLLDILPLFVSLTARRANLPGYDPWLTKSQWLELALEFMAQAFLEQRVAYNVKGATVLLECFAWGPISTEMPEENRDEAGEHISPDERRSQVTIQEIFMLRERADTSSPATMRTSMESDVEQRVSAEIFDFFRRRTLTRLDPQTYRTDLHIVSSDELSEIYQSLLGTNAPSQLYLRDAFDRKLLEYLRALAQSIDVPLLRQLEEVEDGRRTRIQQDGRRLDNVQTEDLRQIWASRT